MQHTFTIFVDYNQVQNLLPAHDAIVSFALALDNLWKTVCGFKRECQAMYPENIEGEQLLNYLKEVSFASKYCIMYV